MTPQGILDTSYKALVAQGVPARDNEGNCKYFDKETGHRCAVGLLVTEDQAKQLPDGNVYDILHSTCWTPDFFREQEYLLCELQNVHDCYHEQCGLSFHDYLKKHYKHIAKRFELSTKELV